MYDNKQIHTAKNKENASFISSTTSIGQTMFNLKHNSTHLFDVPIKEKTIINNKQLNRSKPQFNALKTRKPSTNNSFQLSNLTSDTEVDIHSQNKN